MKTFKKLNTLFLAPIFALLIVTSCNNDDDNPDLPQVLNIVGTAINTPELSILVEALQAADGNLPVALSGGPFTVFAPTNDAFSAFLSANGFSSLSDVPTDVLSQILLNHVVSGSLESTDLDTGYGKTLATQATSGENLSIYIDTSSGVRLNGVSNVSVANISASNGVIHIVDAVIGLPNIVDHALANSNLSSLVGALTTDGNTTFTDLLSSAGDFTVFAPTNAAFSTFTNPNNNDLNQILSNHVIAGTTAISTNLSNGYVNTAAVFNETSNNISMYINTDNGVTLNGVSNVAIADIVASNGVIHVVDAVIDLPNIVDFAVSNPDLSILVAALTRDDLAFDYVTTLSTGVDSSPAPFTVFAPTNDAFAALLAELEVSALSDIDEPTLKATLDHHAVAMANVRSTNLTDNMTVGTLGGNITANITSGATLTDANDRVSNIIAVDIQAANGVIHVIDKVVLPPL